MALPEHFQVPTEWIWGVCSAGALALTSAVGTLWVSDASQEQRIEAVQSETQDTKEDIRHMRQRIDEIYNHLIEQGDEDDE